MRASLTESPGVRLRLDYAQISLIGARENNQDRVGVVSTEASLLAVVCDGMGGHSDGERAAAIAEQTLSERFKEAPKPLIDPLGFLHLALGAAHQRVVIHGITTPVESRPRATCAACIVQDGSAYWGHVGDSRIYLLRGRQIVQRTRDHSHVELLLREGLIEKDEMQGHPMRNYVESCLGGEALLPEMTIGLRVPVTAGDVLLLCTDGLWGNLGESDLMAAFADSERTISQQLESLGKQAVSEGGPTCDNTSAVVIRVLE
jgi:serine/threonine protein phosphatase PrpC